MPLHPAALRLGLASLAAALAVVSFAEHRSLRAERERLSAWLEQGGAVDARMVRELAREPDVDGLRLRAARMAFARETAAAARLDPSTHEGRQEMRASAARLDQAARLAGEALAARPASWEAAMVLGGARYLSWSHARDSRLFTSAESWEEPLRAALRLAPVKREPVRFLAAAYLEIWPALSPAKRETARRLVAEVLRDPEELQRFLEPWLAAAGDRRTALSVIPPDPRAWERAQRFYAGRGDWQGFDQARSRWERALRTQLRARLSEADRRLARGDTLQARSLYLAAAADAPPGMRDRELVEAALTRCPPGPVGREMAESLGRHLEWALERCLLAGCPFPPPVLKRLGRLAGPSPPQEAMAYVMAGDLAKAVSLERRSEALWSEEWAPYHIAKARALIERRDPGAAEAALGLVHASWWKRPAYWLARRDLARATGETGDLLAAEDELRGLVRRDWPAFAWIWRGERARLEMLTAGAARGIEIALDEAPAGGALVEARLDGAPLGMFPAFPARPLRLATPLPPGLHVLELESLGGGRVAPGAARLF